MLIVVGVTLVCFYFEFRHSRVGVRNVICTRDISTEKFIKLCSLAPQHEAQGWNLVHDMIANYLRSVASDAMQHLRRLQEQLHSKVTPFDYII